MKKICLYLVSQMLLAGSLLFSSQGLSEDVLEFYADSNQIEGMQPEVLSENNLAYQKIYIHDFNVTPTGLSINVRESMDSEATLKLFEKSVLCVVDDRAYLNPYKLLIYKDHYLLLNDQQQWIRLDEIFKDRFWFLYSC